MTKIKRTEEQELLQMILQDHLQQDPASSVTLKMVTCEEDFPSDDQNQRDGGARIVANDHLDDRASSVLLHFFAKRTVIRMTFFGWMGLKFAPDLPLVWRILNTNFSRPKVQELEQRDQ